ncbi:MAG TPA: DUF2892 domain-containing protein [Sedimenticola sp.]|nr:DUF2892 domain-containing protein [Sedimenticola sp.]
MKENVGGLDRILRFAIGMGLIGWGIITQNLWGAIGAIPVVTAVIGWCPAYTSLGICTGKKCKT